MSIKEFFSFRQNRFFWLNIVAMILVVCGLLFAVLSGLDRYTHHGEAVVVPDVKGMSLNEAIQILRSKKLLCEVSDSSYVKNLPAGCILDYNPSAGHKVKKGRTIYLTVNTLGVPLCQVPDVADNSSLRQAEARLLVSGFKLAEIDTVAGEKDWVYGVKYRGRMLQQGERVPVGASLSLMVGNGEAEVVQEDSTLVNEEKHTTVEPETTGDDESWF